MTTTRTIAALAGLALAGLAHAANFSENFDSYAAGSQMHGVNGWKGWDNNPAAGALVSSAKSFSGANSVAVTNGTDLVRQFNVVGGVWSFDAKQWISTGSTGQSYFILMNTYVDGANNNNGYWSVQVVMNASNNTVSDTFRGGNTVALVRDQWVDIHVDINLDANTYQAYYNGSLITSTAWKSSGASASRIGAVDLYSSGGSSFYDDVGLTQVPAPSAAALLFLGGFVASGRSRPKR